MKRITNQDTFALLFPDDVVGTTSGQVQVDLVTVLGEVGPAAAAAAAAQASADAAQATADDAVVDAVDALAAAAAAQDDATQALADASITWLPVRFMSALASTLPIGVIAPITGTFSHLIVVAQGLLSGAVLVETQIGGEGVTNGSVSVTLTGVAPVAATPTANNAVVALTTVVEAFLNTENVEDAELFVLFGFTRTPT